MVTSFAVTGGVFGVFLFARGDGVTAEFIDLDVRSHTIAYEVLIIDDDGIHVEGSLTILLETEEGTREHVLRSGLNVGVFDDLKAGKYYRLRIMVNEGFGVKTLYEVSVKTAMHSTSCIKPVLLLEKGGQLDGYG